MRTTLQSLWRDQSMRYEPPTPALVDAYYELPGGAGFEMAWRLHWCQARGVKPRILDERDARGEPVGVLYSWNGALWSYPGVAERFAVLLSDPKRGRMNWWAKTLRVCYEKLLILDRSDFPC